MLRMPRSVPLLALVLAFVCLQGTAQTVGAGGVTAATVERAWLLSDPIAGHAFFDGWEMGLDYDEFMRKIRARGPDGIYAVALDRGSGRKSLVVFSLGPKR